jgi:hypothetical protein
LFLQSKRGRDSFHKVLALVGDDEHRRVGGVALHMLPGGAATRRAALVVVATASANAMLTTTGLAAAIGLDSCRN